MSLDSLTIPRSPSPYPRPHLCLSHSGPYPRPCQRLYTGLAAGVSPGQQVEAVLSTGLDWTGLDWTGLGWTGLDWTGLDWT